MAEDFSDKNKDYGLPEVEPQPINRDQPGIVSYPPKVESQPEDKRDNKPVIIVLSVVGALILASLLYLLFWDNEGEGEAPGRAVVEDRVVMDPEETDETPSNDVDPNQAELSEAIPVITEEPGSIVTISERTNRYYIFVGSYKFRAYARRHAEELAADGFAVKLITPDNWVGMRVAVGNYANIEEAGVDAQQIRSRYGNEVVISKY
jgi:hypothetical protein